MTYKILLWICGIASILGIVLYLIDKTTNKEFSIKLTLGLIIGGIILAVILALTEPEESNHSAKEQKVEPVNNIEVKENTNSPITNHIESQTNNYYQNKDESKKLTSSSQKVTKEENIAESSGQSDGITANKVSKGTMSEEKGNIKNTVKSINQQGGITANEVHIYEKEKEPKLTKETLNYLFKEALNLMLPPDYPSDGKVHVATILHDETLSEFKKYEKKGWLTIKSNGSVSSMGANNKIGNSIEDKKRPWGLGNGFVITLNKAIYENE